MCCEYYHPCHCKHPRPSLPQTGICRNCEEPLTSAVEEVLKLCELCQPLFSA